MAARFLAAVVAGFLVLGGTQPWMAWPNTTGKTEAALKDRHGDPLPSGATARLGSIRLRHAGAVRCLAFDGDVIVSAGDDGWTHRWEAATGKRLASFPSPVALLGAAVTEAPAAISPDGRLLAVVSEAGDQKDKLTLWQTADGKVKAELKDQSLLSQLSAGAVAFSGDGKILAVADLDSVIRVYETATGTEMRKITRPEKGSGREGRLALSRDGKLLAATTTGTGAITIWETGKGKLEHTLKAGDARMAALAFAPDAKTLVSGTEEGTIQLWNLETAKVQHTFKDGQREAPLSFLFLEFSPDGRHVVIGDVYNSSVLLWDPQTGKVARQLEAIADPRCAAFSADSKTLLTGDSDHRVRVWDVASGKEKAVSANPDSVTRPVAVAADGKTLATRARGGVIQLWSLPDCKPLRTLAKDAWVYSFALSPKGGLLVTGGADGYLRFWDLDTGKEHRKIMAHSRKNGDKEEPRPVACVAFSKDGKHLVSGGFDSTVRVWDVESAKELQAWKDRKGWVFTVAFSPDGKTVAGGGCSDDSMTTCLWDVTTGKLQRKLEQSPAMALAFSRGGDVLVTAGGLFGGWWITFADVNSGKMLAQSATASRKEFDEFMAASVSPDGQTLALGSLRGIFLWDMTTRKQLRHLHGPFGACTHLAFTPDGRTLVAAHADMTVLFWDVSDRVAKKMP